MKRRKFIQAGSLLSLTSATLNAIYANGRENNTLLKFGVCTDVHKDLVPDADTRLQEFVNEANKRKVDFIVQLGDFCFPKKTNQEFLDIYNSFGGPKYHVIGNHDMDGGFEKKDTVKFYGMPDRYYSFNKNNFHFIVLDGTVGAYPWTPDEEQIAWLDEDLKKTNLPTMVFIHQPLERDVISNADPIRNLIESHKLKGHPKVIACLMGHRHMDYFNVINQIPHLEINSMSYFWLGEKYMRVPKDKKLDEQFPAIKYFSRYEKSLFCFIEIKENGEFTLEGRSSKFIDGLPEERSYPYVTIPKDHVTANIASRNLQITL